MNVPAISLAKCRVKSYDSSVMISAVEMIKIWNMTF